MALRSKRSLYFLSNQQTKQTYLCVCQSRKYAAIIELRTASGIVLSTAMLTKFNQMEKQQLQESLTHLHTALSDREQIDDDTRGLLKALSTDIDRLLDDSTENTPEDVKPVTEQVDSLLLKFEADHPDLTAALNRVASALANMGI